MKNFAIIGAGFNGLITAHLLKKKYPNSNIKIFERTERVGGSIRTEYHNDFVFELGPQYINNNDVLTRIIKDLSFTDNLVFANNKNMSFLLFKNKELNFLPNNLLSFLSNKNTFKPFKTLKNDYSQKPIDVYDSIRSFSIRHFGRENTFNLIDPLVQHFTYGDPGILSTNANLRVIKENERKFGSFVKGYLKNKSIIKQNLVSFKGGLESFLNEIVKKNKLDIVFGDQVRHLKLEENGLTTVSLSNSSFTYDQVFVTTPSYVSAHLLQTTDEEYFKTLGLFKYAPISIVKLAYAQNVIKQKAQAVLISSNERSECLSIILNSNLFKDHQGEYHTQLTVLIGGVLNSNVIEQNPSQLSQKAIEYVKKYLKLDDEPIYTKVRQYSRAVPVYNMGVEKIWQRLDDLKIKYPTIHLLNSYYDSLSFSEMINKIDSTINELDS